MINTRFISNQTAMPLLITLYIQAGNDISRIYGSVNAELQAGETRAVEFGNLRNNVLIGLRVNPIPLVPEQSYCGAVHKRGDDVDVWLNSLDTLGISLTSFNRLDVCFSVEDLVGAHALAAVSRLSANHEY